MMLVYDHQKGGTDIPRKGDSFAEDCKYAGMDAAILFPFGGPETQRHWIRSLELEQLAAPDRRRCLW